ncbi:uncharacterized protein LOC119095182 [Pollicipes pollicipes]|uniref:uncharacterized protein LOC119095182 n=1 Tax=Pollicipes pollicipes TaxID=41117 RepID=UPI0018856EBF|nr:uncharacterized protein LOC119095182 [Pollicipes pollicipes]
MSGMKNATIETNNDTNESAMLRKNMLPLDILLGKNVKTWHQLKEAVGIAGDSDMLIRLMSFFVDAQGIDLSESPSVQPDVEPAREPEPEPEPVGASSFIVIHRADQMHRGGDAQMRVAARKLQIKNEDGLDVWRPGDDDYMAPLQYERKPRQRRPGAAPRLRGSAQGPDTVFVAGVTDAVAHAALDGMLWREAVFRGRPMPLDDVRLLVR